MKQTKDTIIVNIYITRKLRKDGSENGMTCVSLTPASASEFT